MSDDLVAPPLNRRASTRRSANIPTALMTADWSLFAVLEDVSESGALFLTQEEIVVGTILRVHVLLGSQVQPSVTATARVVRSQKREGKNLLWTYEVAVSCETQEGNWNETLAAVVKRQATLRSTDV